MSYPNDNDENQGPIDDASNAADNSSSEVAAIKASTKEALWPPQKSGDAPGSDCEADE